jgi:hypothetical protein
MKLGVLVRLSESEIQKLDAMRLGESRPACLRRLLRDASAEPAATSTRPSAGEALELLAAQARDGRTSAVIAYARVLCGPEPDISALRVDQLIREASRGGN